MTDKIAVMICGSGGHDDAAVEEFNSLSVHMRKRLPEYDVEGGFLVSSIRDGLDKLAAGGAQKIVCVPGTLFAAGREKNGLPFEIEKFGDGRHGPELIFGRELAIDSKLLAVARDRIEQAEKEAGGHIPREDTLLMVVGHGADDSNANSNVSKVARMLWEGMGFGWAEASYSDAACPLADAGLEKAVKFGYGRIIVFPYFLFAGEPVRRIYAWADDCAAANPNVEIVKAGHLNDRERLLDCFVDRVDEAVNGARNMNCQFCAYRERIIGADGHGGHAHDHRRHRHHHHSHDHAETSDGN